MTNKWILSGMTTLMTETFGNTLFLYRIVRSNFQPFEDIGYVNESPVVKDILSDFPCLKILQLVGNYNYHFQLMH